VPVLLPDILPSQARAAYYRQSQKNAMGFSVYLYN